MLYSQKFVPESKEVAYVNLKIYGVKKENGVP